MDIAIIQEYLTAEVLILIPVLWALGYFLKRTPAVKDWLIVWIVVFVGILCSLFLVGFNVNGVIQGILAAAVSVLGYDLLKQTKKA
jgi:hypothetical protein